MLPVPIRLPNKRYERLSPQDASFLSFEKPDLPMHVGMVAFFERRSFLLPSGDIDLARFRAYMESRLDSAPRCRHKLAYIPFARQPVWVADQAFDIANHVREVRLATPGDETALAHLAGEVFSAQLDRARPLWEAWIVQGFEDPDRFAVICKVHHCMIDGVAAIDFMGALLTQDASAEIVAVPAYTPQAPPNRMRLLLDEASRWLGASVSLAFAARRFATSPATRASFLERTRAIVTLLARGIHGTSNSPLKMRATARRTFAWTTTDRTGERSIRARLAGSRDDISVATATGAARSLLLRRGAQPEKLRVRAMAPMSVRSLGERGKLGNRVSMLIVDLPVDEPDAARRLERVANHVVALKESKAGLGVEVLMDIDRWTGVVAQTLCMEIATRFSAYNLVITNIPGPPMPLYALDAKLLAMHPLGPVFGGHHISIAAMTYLGEVNWGVQYGGTGDAEAEVALIARDITASFDALVQAADAAPPRLRVIESEAADDTALAASS